MIETVKRLKQALDESSYDSLVLGSAEHVAYSTGYRSVAGDLFSTHRMLAVVAADRTLLVGGASDGAAAIEFGTHADDYIPFGTFYFESVEPNAPESSLADQHDTLLDAASHAIERIGFTGRVGLDAGASDLAELLARVGATPTDATDWMYAVRAIKLPEEVALLSAAARLAERSIDVAIGAAHRGVSEKELAILVASTMAAGGGTPRFTVVTSGPRSALSDARPSDRVLVPGDLLRFDVGCTIDGYWSDIGRTAVVGEPDNLQAARYAAILAGEEAQLEAARPGITASELFDVAVAAVESAGLKPYRRHHCGHAIGTQVYERPVIAPEWSTMLEPGMVLCVETPYYEVGWGGMMVEDALVVTEEGVDMLTTSDRSLRVV